MCIRDSAAAAQGRTGQYDGLDAGSPMVYLRLPVADRLSLRLLFRFVVRSASEFQSGRGALRCRMCRMARMGSYLGQTGPAGERSRNPVRSTARRIRRIPDRAILGLSLIHISAKYENARNQLADTKLYAPFDGYVKRRRFDPPTVVAAGMPVITFLSGKNPEVELFIPASTYIRRREIASFAAVFDFLQGQKIPLRLLHVDPSANANQLYAVRLALPVNTEIAATPGMNATVEVAMRQETEASVEIPASALFSNGDKTSYVWIYRQDGTIARRRVEVVRLHTDGTATIADGLNEGERIVVAGVHKLTEGQRVAPLPAPSKTNEGGLL